MDIYQGSILGLLLLIGAETSYLALKQPNGVRRKSGASILLDTSVLIDGRIVSLAKAGFVLGTLVVPRSVVAELQYMADNADHDKRMRARYGLDVIQELQQLKDVDVEVLQDGTTTDVDAQLVILAKRYGAHLCTIDYNLNKVAQVEGVTVLNVNELAQALRTTHLPGEQRKLQLVQRGSDSHQAVGYLEDGTMVVVEQSNNLIGQEVMVEFTRVLQTQAGRMMFARRVDTQPAVAPKKYEASKLVQNKSQKVNNKPTPPKQQQPSQQSQNQPKNQKPQKQQYNKPQRRTSPEDSLLELAKKKAQ